MRATRARLEGVIAFGPVAGEQLIDPGASHPVGGRYLPDRAALHQHSSNHQAGFRHAADSSRAASGMSCDICPLCHETGHLAAHYCDVARHSGRLEPLTRFWSGLADALGLVVDVWVEDELADDFAGGGVDDADVEAVDQHQDGGSGVGSADADVVEPAVVAEAEFAVGVDDVAADPGLRFAVWGGWWGGFGAGLVGRGGGAPVEGAVWPAGVVVGDEGVAEGLQLR